MLHTDASARGVIGGALYTRVASLPLCNRRPGLVAMGQLPPLVPGEGVRVQRLSPLCLRPVPVLGQDSQRRALVAPEKVLLLGMVAPLKAQRRRCGILLDVRPATAWWPSREEMLKELFFCRRRARPPLR